MFCIYSVCRRFAICNLLFRRRKPKWIRFVNIFKTGSFQNFTETSKKIINKKNKQTKQNKRTGKTFLLDHYKDEFLITVSSLRKPFFSMDVTTCKFELSEKHYSMKTESGLLKMDRLSITIIFVFKQNYYFLFYTLNNWLLLFYWYCFLSFKIMKPRGTSSRKISMELFHLPFPFRFSYLDYSFLNIAIPENSDITI